MERQTVKVKFGGEITGVDVDTFTRTVLAYAAVARAAISGIDASRGAGRTNRFDPTRLPRSVPQPDGGYSQGPL